MNPKSLVITYSSRFFFFVFIYCKLCLGKFWGIIMLKFSIDWISIYNLLFAHGIF